MLAPLIERGQRDGAFRRELPAHWHLAMILAIVHAASAELRAGRLPADEIEAAVVATVLGALQPPPTG
jgi:TetR/AcrR family transcriptional regulator, mexCD-oprJ operon repressor